MADEAGKAESQVYHELERDPQGEVMYCIKESISYTEKIQRSEFICVLYPVYDATEVKERLAEHQKLHANATHNCFAYVLGDRGETQYYSDAGEPSGTAGKPMLNALLRAELTYVLAVVTRYYGGIKLGVRGLIEAYGGVCSGAIESAGKEAYVVRKRLGISCDYSCYETLQKYLHHKGFSQEGLQYAENVCLNVIYPQAEEEEFLAFLDGLKIQKGLDYWAEKD